MMGDKVSLNGKEYTAAFYSLNESPETNHEPDASTQSGKPWKFPTNC